MSNAHCRLTVGLLAFALSFVGAANAASYNVTSSADSGAGSLREAIDQANTNGGGTILIRPIAGQEIHLFENLPTIESSITLIGNGVTLMGNGGYRAVMVGNGATDATLTLDGVTFGTNAVVFVNPMGHVYTRSQAVAAPAAAALVPVAKPLPTLPAKALASAMSPAATSVDGTPVFAAKTVSVSSPIPPPTVPAVTPVQTVWSARRGEWLSDVIEAWSKKAGWQAPVWQLREADGAKRDYKIDGDATFSGGFVEATSDLFKAYTDSGFAGLDPSSSAPHSSADHPMRVQIMVDQKIVVVSPANSKASQ